MPELFAGLREWERKRADEWLRSGEHGRWKTRQYEAKYQAQVRAVRAEVQARVDAHIAFDGVDLKAIGAAILGLYLNREIDRLTRERLPGEVFGAAAGCHQTDVLWEHAYNSQIEAVVSALTPKAPK